MCRTRMQAPAEQCLHTAPNDQHCTESWGAAQYLYHGVMLHTCSFGLTPCVTQTWELMRAPGLWVITAYNVTLTASCAWTAPKLHMSAAWLYPSSWLMTSGAM